MKNNVLSFLLLGAMSLFSLTSCDDGNDYPPQGNSRLSVYLTDAPVAYDAVYIDIQDVRVNYSSDTTNGWQSLGLLRPGVYNLLDFRNGLDTLLISKDLPAGKISQIRLILGNNNSVVVGGTSYPLETPSAQQSGLKLNVHAELVADVEYRLWLDFDAAKSIVTTGSNKYILKPVIRTFTQATSGSIKGIALPAISVKGIYAIQQNDTVAAALPNAVTGTFVLPGLNAGAYNVAIVGDGILRDTTLLGVNVTVGQASNVGTITLR
ncbi:uncharacterized protein DUF4382 [Chitinophaga skermanii]|uniref:Uncharacterized protein DUF4382 n=1 Tax=Chitinophaga skermanii TaxID=331697 RepID=A0A327QKH7_9BACT|nr:DUF4382 domain-containing protein [Chitinophaga skermanii]RAJ04214.1 uncharacterized protein DUF4382 [Chitinophaga skermanii]